MTNSKRNILIDIFKYVLVFFVISIHYCNTDNTLPIFRMAVPMFFMLSGFFNYTEDKNGQQKKNANFIKNGFKYFLIGSLTYICYDFIKCIMHNGDIGQFFSGLYYTNFVKDFIFLNNPNNSGYHLWFLIALFICSIIHYFICKFDKTKVYYFLIPALLIVFFLFNGYLHNFFEYSLDYCYTRNVLFMGLPIFAIGYNLGKLKKHKFNTTQTILLGIFAVVSLALSILESKIVVMEFYICSLVSSALFILFFNSVELKENRFSNWYYKWIGKDAVFYIYILHILVFNTIVRFFHTNSFVNALLIFAFSFVIYEVLHLLKLLVKFIVKSIKNKPKIEQQPTTQI